MRSGDVPFSLSTVKGGGSSVAKRLSGVSFICGQLRCRRFTSTSTQSSEGGKAFLTPASRGSDEAQGVTFQTSVARGNRSAVSKNPSSGRCDNGCKRARPGKGEGRSASLLPDFQGGSQFGHGVRRGGRKSTRRRSDDFELDAVPLRAFVT